MSGIGSSRALSIVLSIALAVSGLVVLGGSAVGDDPGSIGSAEGLDVEAPSLAEDGRDPGIGKPLSREAIRAWLDKLDLPQPEFMYQPDAEPGVLWDPGDSGGNRLASEGDVIVHKADQAQLLGFNGSNVTVASVDTGHDFAHPDFRNVTKRVENAASPYFLHPVVYDGASMNDYLVFGEPSPTMVDGSNECCNSWYLNTTYSTIVMTVGPQSIVQWTDGTTTLTWDVTGVPGLTPGEEVRIAFHPDDALLAIWGDRPGVILYNHAGAGPPFDSVLVDLNGDMSLIGEKRAYMNTAWASFDPEAELIYRDITGDGVQDVSGGMVAFIADGVRKIPYAEHQIRAMNFTFQTLLNDNNHDAWANINASPQANLVPAMGDLLILYGDFNGGQQPFTFNGAHGTWTSSAMVGQAITGGAAIGPVIRGMAPGAKIIGVGNTLDAKGGVDPFGTFNIYAGLMFTTEGFDGIIQTGDEADITSNSWGSSDWSGWSWSSRFADYLSFIQSDQNTIFVFAAGNSGAGYGTRVSPAGGASLVVAAGMESFLYRVDPWHNYEGGPNPTAGDITVPFNHGPSAMGRHLVDGIANSHFAYSADTLNGNLFDADSGQQLDGSAAWVLWSGTSHSTPVMAGLLALLYDAFIQAHGFKPESSMAKTILKNSADDIKVDPFLSGPGLPNALRAVKIANEVDGLSLDREEWNVGDYQGTAFPGYANVVLPGDTVMTTVTLENHRQTLPMDVTISDGVLVKSGSLTHTFTRVVGTPATDDFLLTDAGLLAPDGSVLVPGAGLFGSADVLRITMFFDRIRLFQDPVYLLDIGDWTDVNSNGAFEPFDEENLMVRSVISDERDFGPSGWAFVYDPAARTQDGLLIELLNVTDAPVNLPFTLQIDFYERSDFSWVSASSSLVNIPPASTAPVTLTATVPALAGPGLYEAVVLFTLDDGNVTTLPVVVNVAIPSLPSPIGDNTFDSGIYQQGLQYGGFDVRSATASGDFRYYFIDMAQALNVTMTLEWDETASDAELYVLSPIADWFSDNQGLRYGPNTMRQGARATESSAGLALTAHLEVGLNVLVARSTWLSGLAAEEHPQGEAGTITVSPPSLSGVGVPVDGTADFTITSDLAFPDVVGSVKTGVALSLTDQSVDSYPCQGICGGVAFVDYLFGAPNRVQTIMPPGASEATWSVFFHSGARDVDTGLWFDADCDGNYLRDDHVEGAVGGTLANPEVITLPNAMSPTLTPGCYSLHVAGFDVDPGSLYDLTYTAVTAPFVTFTSLPSSIAPGVPVDISVAYSLPHLTIAQGGTIFVGTSTVAEVIGIPVFLTADLPPRFSNPAPVPGGLTNDTTPTISVEYVDAPDAFMTAVDPGSVMVWVDGTDMTSSATITATSLTLTPPTALADGLHNATVQAADQAGSTNTTTWFFTVDTTAPSLTITAPTVGLTNDPSVTIAGQTEPGANVTVTGVSVTVDASGSFSTTRTFAEGSHMLPVVATDGAGNSRTEVVEITVDTTPPALSISSPADASTVSEAMVTVTGTTEAGATLTINGDSVSVGADGSFSTEVTLQQGANTITAEATDPAGNVATESVEVTFAPPGIALSPELLLIIGLVIAAAVVGLVLFLYWRKRRELEEFGPPPEE